MEDIARLFDSAEALHEKIEERMIDTQMNSDAASGVLAYEAMIQEELHPQLSELDQQTIVDMLFRAFMFGKYFQRVEDGKETLPDVTK